MLGGNRQPGRPVVLGFGVIGLGARGHRICRTGRKAMRFHLGLWLRRAVSTSMFAFMAKLRDLVTSVPATAETRRGEITG